MDPRDEEALNIRAEYEKAVICGLEDKANDAALEATILSMQSPNEPVPYLFLSVPSLVSGWVLGQASHENDKEPSDVIGGF